MTGMRPLNDARPAAADVREAWEKAAREAALAVILRREKAYVRLVRLTTSAPDYRDPDAWCAQVLAEAFDDQKFGDLESRRDFYGWALTSRPGCKLLPVLASHDLLHRGDRAGALEHAKRATDLNPHDLYAQKLYLRCRWRQDLEDAFRGRFCKAPFEKMETSPNGDVYFCCPAWLPVAVGNIHRHGAGEIWNSSAAQDIRRSILDGSYRYCSRMHCPKLNADRLPRNEEVSHPAQRAVIAARAVRMNDGPIRVALNHDRSCNLSCPSCRTRMIVARKDEQASLDRLAEGVILPLLRNARRVHVSGSGEAFASHHFRYVLKRINRREFPRLKIDLQTNGTLLDRRAWRDLGLAGLVHSVYVSIDAACAETYARVRRGGSFGQLMANLAFVAGLKRTGEVERVRLDFVVQTLNFKEMPLAADLVRRLGFDGLKFQMIRNWGTYSIDEFKFHNIGSAEHPHFGEFLDVLADPRLEADFIEYWGFYDVDPKALHRQPARAGGLP